MAYRQPRAGQFTDRLELHRLSEESDGMGGVTSTWSVIETDIAAAVEPTKGKEEIVAERLSGINPKTVTLRSNETTLTITTTDRLVDPRKGETLTIKWIGSLDERERFLTLHCVEGSVL